MQTTIAPTEQLSSNAAGNDVTEHQDELPQPDVASEITDVFVESNVPDRSETNGDSIISADLIAIQNDQPLTYSQTTARENIVDMGKQVLEHRDTQMSRTCPFSEQPTDTSQQTFIGDNSRFNLENNGVSSDHVPFDHQAVISQNVNSVDDFENSVTVQPKKAVSSEETPNDGSVPNQGSPMELRESQILEEEAAA